MNNPPILDPKVRAALVAYLLPWADDELILGHRDSEWTGFAPILEEDLAFSSIAQDELGHAALIYHLVADLTGENPDHLALRRPANAYRHAPLVERPNGDWAYTIARHYLYDLADSARLEVLSGSSYGPLAGIARKMAREEHYHRLHGEMWWERLAAGTNESRERLAAAARAVTPLVGAVLGGTDGQEILVAERILPGIPAGLAADWRDLARPFLIALDPELGRLPDEAPEPRELRPASADFLALHAEMTMVSASGLGERW
ncbi:MAG TPA: 1,2-phenylacetyl-CoA epoxidase subunit PaaC [Chloroflexota bacterium]|nr:1,2-phenylacetyl-CoA epoxidase subunit PaaC [Chloroflexota bacterium]